MTNINLLESVDNNGSHGKKFVLGKSFIIPVVVLVAIFSLLAGTKAYFSYLEKKNQDLISENDTEIKNLTGKNPDRVINFERKMELGYKELSAKEDYEDYLKELETLMVSGALIDSLKYSSSGIEVAISADNFNTVARQILSFKNSSHFKDLKMDKTSRKEDGGIMFTLKK